MMFDTARGRVFAALLVGFFILAAGGVMLLLTPVRRNDPVPGEPGPPAWAAIAPKRSQFEGRLQPIDPAESRELLARLGARFSELIPGLTTLNAEIQVNRTLLEGYEYEARLVLDQQQAGGGRQIEMQIHRAGEAPVAIQVDIVGNQVDRVAMMTMDTRDTLFVLDDLDPSRLEPLLNLPVALGDLQLLDLFGLLGGLGQGAIQVAGRLEQPRTLPLLVVSVAFPAAPEPEAAQAARSYNGRGSSALLYLDLQGPTPRALRVFDRDGRLVRVYEDFEFEGAPGEAALRSFRIASSPTGSHSLFRFRKLDRTAGPIRRPE